MNNLDIDTLEAELRKLTPARPPDEFVARLAKSRLCGGETKPDPVTGSLFSRWWSALRWVAPAAVASLVVGVLLFGHFIHPAGQSPSESGPQRTASANSVLKADNVEVDQQLIAAFDAVTQMPDGEPVRFRCRQWMDQVVLRDSTRGVAVERRVPRLEIVPVRFETY